MSEHQSGILKAMHETASGFHKVGVMSEKTMREFDALCLPSVPKYTPGEIKDIRLESASQKGVPKRLSG